MNYIIKSSIITIAISMLTQLGTFFYLMGYELIGIFNIIISSAFLYTLLLDYFKPIKIEKSFPERDKNKRNFAIEQIKNMNSEELEEFLRKNEP